MPACPYATSRAIGFRPFFAARADVSISTTAAAASLMPDALPAVTVPFSLMNTALSFAHAFDRGVGADVLVGVELHRSLLALELDRQDLALEVARCVAAAARAVALDGERVLLLARDARTSPRRSRR